MKDLSFHILGFEVTVERQEIANLFRPFYQPDAWKCKKYKIKIFQSFLAFDPKTDTKHKEGLLPNHMRMLPISVKSVQNGEDSN